LGYNNSKKDRFKGKGWDVSYLYDGALAGDFEDLALAHLTVSESNVDDFGVSKVR